MPLKINGATSGGITLTTPAEAGTNTLTLPARTGNIITSADSGTVTQTMLGSGVASNGPAFSAYLSANQNVTSGVSTKVQLNTKLFDTANCYDNTTNYRFTPNVAGYYQVNYLAFGTGTNPIAMGNIIYKNGSAYANTTVNYTSGQSGYNPQVSTIIYMNGTTDYLEFYSNVTATTPYIYASGQVYTMASAALVRAA